VNEKEGRSRAKLQHWGNRSREKKPEEKKMKFSNQQSRAHEREWLSWDNTIEAHNVEADAGNKGILLENRDNPPAVGAFLKKWL